MIADCILDEIDRYVDSVLSGEIVACKLIKAACQRHVDDLKRESTQEFPYHFDRRYAAKICRFFPRVLRHSIGRYAGQPFELEPWQMFCEASLFGWKRDADELRRFRTSYESVARKNGKSTRVAGRALLMAGYDHNPLVADKLNKSFAPEPVAQIILAASKRDQADKVIYAEIERMRRTSPSVLGATTDKNRQIEFTANNGTIETVGSDKPYDGRNPHLVAMDEIHAWREFHREFHDTMITGEGARDQSLVSYITTAGSDTSHLWQEVYNYAKSVAMGTVDDPTYFAACYELDEEDDPFDETNWIKANPNLHVSVSLDYLRGQAKKMRESDAGIKRFTRYHGNRRVSSNSTAFDLDKWDACRVDCLSDWSTADAIGAGVDLGGRDDLAAYAMVARWQIAETEDESGKTLPVYRYEASVASYISEASKKRDLTKQPFAQWIYTDLIHACRHPIGQLTRDFIEEAQALGVRSVAYDPYNGQAFCEEVELDGMVPVRMSQNPSMFNEPIGDLIEAINDGRFAHDGNPMLRWCIGNAVLDENSRQQVMFDKKSSAEKIDPVVAMTMAFRVCMLAPARPKGKLYL